MNTPDSPSTVPVRVWDLPTRLFHWALLAAVATAVVTAQIGGNAMDWHVRAGLVTGALLVFRLLWGGVGGRWSRFSQFVRSPAGVWRYLRSGAAEVPGHNPLGGWSVLGLLAVLLAQGLTGLMADDEIATAGPLVSRVPEDWVALATAWHKGPGQALMFTLIGLHVAAIVFYAVVKRRRLVPAMVTGDQALPPGTPASRDDGRTRLLAAALLAACGVLAWWVSGLGG